MKEKLWRFTDNLGTFESSCADRIKSLYFPVANENIMSSLSPDLHGDVKSNQDAFLLTPVSRIDLTDSRSSRNFWVRVNSRDIWSVTGVSKDIKQIDKDKFSLKAGLLWQEVERVNRGIGLKANILSFVPSDDSPFEIMRVSLTNVSSKIIEITPIAAIPIYARGANNIRDHRHVSSLFNMIMLDKYGVLVNPTLSFNEAGHKLNKNIYCVLGWDEKNCPPQYIYPTHEMFCGQSDLEYPDTVVKNLLPSHSFIQGKEAMGGLRFKKVFLSKGQTRSYIIVLGIMKDIQDIKRTIKRFSTISKVNDALSQTKKYWGKISSFSEISTGNIEFDNWFRWVGVQPTLRRIFGCSFLPDFDYGKGGRGWRDLWQDCLGLILNDQKNTRNLLINNFPGVRTDGSNATIIKKTTQPLRAEAGFIADRNNIARVWMDHGVWPLLTLDLYMNETGDFDILWQDAEYFCDQHIFRSQKLNHQYQQSGGNKLKDRKGKVYKGSIFEHLLVENLVQFFNVGKHNNVRLEGADWNDGFDMATGSGESVAFSAMYAYNLKLLADLLEKTSKQEIKVFKELTLLFKNFNYENVSIKKRILNDYLNKVSFSFSASKITIKTDDLIKILREKSEWMMKHIRDKEFLKEGFFNGYYDNDSKRVEGLKGGNMRMTLTGQVFPIMGGVANSEQIKSVLKNVVKYLKDKELKGIHLNTDFKSEYHKLGRAFSFVYGDKENGAFFNHMVVMFSFALYKRGYIKEGWQALSSIYNMAVDTNKSRIYPCLPEYFDLEARGMYSYLTGSASWFVLTMIREVFGVKGDSGDLVIEPKLTAENFRNSEKISINRIFAGKQLKVIFLNKKGLDWGQYKIKKATFNSSILPLTGPSRLVIPLSTINKLASDKPNIINIILG